ncbi:hypothetical protein ACU4GA_18815 [Methylobacterium oryzae CBMB20]
MSTGIADAEAELLTHHLPAVMTGRDAWFLDTRQALGEEMDHFCGPLQPGDHTPWQARADQARLAALCLSGGGIRSATFCLGALQALASRRMLGEFHYLSTVSGGGFAGGWLQTFIRQCGSVAEAERQLGGSGNEIFAKLRRYTNYLTPEVGILSRDTWAGIILYIRNTILNWLIIFPLLLFVPLALLAYRTALEAASRSTLWLPLLLGSGALFVATFSACILLPSHRPRNGAVTAYASPTRIAACIIAPTCLWALALPFTLRALFEQPLPVSGLSLCRLGLAYFAVQVAAYLGGLLWQTSKGHPGLWLYERNVGPWLASSLVSAVLISLGAESIIGWLAGDAAGFDAGRAQVSQFLTVAAPPALIVIHLLQSVIFIGFRKSAECADLDREWVARVDGQLLLAAMGWTGLCLCCLIVSAVALGRDDAQLPAVFSALGALATGPAAAFLGKQVFSRAQSLSAKGRMDDLVMLGLSAMAAVFGISLFALMGWCLGRFLGNAHDWWGDCLMPRWARGGADPGAACGINPYGMILILDLALAAILAGAVWLFGRVNVNRFSMHGVYRNRLTRGFLGSARTRRDADPFTDFDEGDSPRIADLGSEKRLLPVVNMTLNLTDLLHTEWAERKAASFTATPFVCGSAVLDRADMARDLPHTGGPRGAYIRTSQYAGMETRGDRVSAGRGPLLEAADDLRRRGQPELGISFVAPDRVPDDPVQRPARRLAAQSRRGASGRPETRQACELRARAPERTRRPQHRCATGHLSLGWRPFRQSRRVRDAAPALRADRGDRCGPGRTMHLLRPGQRDPQGRGGWAGEGPDGRDADTLPLPRSSARASAPGRLATRAAPSPIRVPVTRDR